MPVLLYQLFRHVSLHYIVCESAAMIIVPRCLFCLSELYLLRIGRCNIATILLVITITIIVAA